VRIYIQTDIEGVAGYVHYYSFSDSIWNYHHVQRMNRLLTAEVNAAALAAKDAGATEVLVNDNHGAAYNILFEELDPICRIIHGRPGRGPEWTPCLDSSIDAAVAIGMHARAGVAGAVCNHSCWHLQDGRGCGYQLSEVAMFGLLCAERGIPLVAISGDQFICEEIREWIPDIRVAQVKESLGLQFANSLHPDRSRELIYQTVRDGVVGKDSVSMPALAGPFSLNVSDRDPSNKILESDLRGESLSALVIDVCNATGARYGMPEDIDDRSWRYPDSVYSPQKV